MWIKNSWRASSLEVLWEVGIFSPSPLIENKAPWAGNLVLPLSWVQLIIKSSLHTHMNPFCWAGVVVPILQMWRQTQGYENFLEIRPYSKKQYRKTSGCSASPARLPLWSQTERPDVKAPWDPFQLSPPSLKSSLPLPLHSQGRQALSWTPCQHSDLLLISLSILMRPKLSFLSFWKTTF